MPGHLVADGQGHVGDRLGVAGARLGQPARDHVGVADGLDLLQTVPLGEGVERTEQVVEDLDDPLRGDPVAAPGEVDEVGEEHGDVGEGVGDDALLLHEAGGDRGGQDVEQQPLRARLLGDQLRVGAVQRPAAADGLAEQQHGREQADVGDAVGEQGRQVRRVLEQPEHKRRPGNQIAISSAQRRYPDAHAVASATDSGTAGNRPGLSVAL